MAIREHPQCCIGEKSYPYPTVLKHKGKLWELKSPTSSGRTEPGTPLGSTEWREVDIKNYKGKRVNIKKRLENQRKKFIFELEDKFAVPRLGSLSGGNKTKTSRASATIYLELENYDVVTPEKSFLKQVV